MINILATTLITLALIYVASFCGELAINHKIVGLKMIGASILVMDAVALTSTTFAGGNLVLAIATFVFAALCLPSIPSAFDKKDAEALISNIFTMVIVIIAGVVLINLR